MCDVPETQAFAIAPWDQMREETFQIVEPAAGEAKAEDPHQSKPSYNYRKERFAQSNPERSFEYDPKKGAQGSAFPYRTGVLPHTNGQVILTHNSNLLIRGYHERQKDEPEDTDTTLGFFFDDVVGLLHLMNNSNKRNPGNTEFDNQSLDHITLLLDAVLLIRDGMARQKHGYKGSPIELACPPVETAERVGDQFSDLVGDLCEYIDPILDDQ